MSDETRVRRRIHKRGYSIFVAVLFALLALLGLHTVGRYCASAISRITNKTAQKQEYEQMLMPLVMFDTVTFEDPATLDNTTLLQSSIWSILLGENRDYEYDEARNIVIPGSDVDVAGHALFGPAVSFAHQSFGDYTINYYYDESIKSYRIPLAAISGYYTPQVETITQQDDVIELEVGYIPPASALNYSVTGDDAADEAPSKFMQYELRRNADTGAYYVYALRLISSQLLGSSDIVTPEFYSGDYTGEDISSELSMPDITTEIDPNAVPGSAGTSGEASSDVLDSGMIVNDEGEIVPAENPADYPTLIG